MQRKEVKGFEGYLVSNTGLVKSLHLYGSKNEGLIKARDRSGYMICQLTKEGKSHTKGVHTLVAEAFIPNPDYKRTVNHKNGDKHDNRVENLERSTDSENCKHRFTGLGQRAVYHGGDKKPVIRITADGEEIFDSLKDAHKKTGTRINSIRDVCNGEQATAGGYKWRWGVYDEKKNNKAYHRPIEYKGKRYPSIGAFAKALGLNYQTIKYRIDSGWDIESAVTREKNKKFNRTRYEKFINKVGHNGTV